MKWSNFWTSEKNNTQLFILFSVCKDEELWALLMAVLWVQLTVWGIQCFSFFRIVLFTIEWHHSVLLRVENISSGPFSAGCSARSLFSLSRTVFILFYCPFLCIIFSTACTEHSNEQHNKKKGWKGMLRSRDQTQWADREKSPEIIDHHWPAALACVWALFQPILSTLSTKGSNLAEEIIHEN